MIDSDFINRLRKMPLSTAAPCAGCTYLVDMESGGNDESGNPYYVGCSYLEQHGAPAVPFLFRQINPRPNIGGAKLGATTHKHVFGPHTDDAVRTACAFRDAGARAAKRGIWRGRFDLPEVWRRANFNRRVK